MIVRSLLALDAQEPLEIHPMLVAGEWAEWTAGLTAHLSAG
jgi:hypothetical protein